MALLCKADHLLSRRYSLDHTRAVKPKANRPKMILPVNRSGIIALTDAPESIQ